jgi:flap endonuclease GEN
MTVSSLWTVLDEAGCGTPVGVEDFSLRGRGDRPDQQTILAVDLSIWICEGLTSTALAAFHANPALHLVYQRTTKLLKLGIGLVFVAEGQRREWSQASPSSQQHELKQRRAGSRFWNASR